MIMSLIVHFKSSTSCPASSKYYMFYILMTHFSYFVDVFEWSLKFSLTFRVKLLWILIYSIVSQMNEEILTAASARRDIFLSRESSKTISIHKGAEHGLDLCHEHINSKVKFLAINKIRLCLIVLYDMAFVSRYFFNFPCQEDPLSLALILGFYY